MTIDLENTYYKLTYVKDELYWEKHIYKSMTLPEPADTLDCSFICRNVEKPNGCDLFLMEVKAPLGTFKNGFIDIRYPYPQSWRPTICDYMGLALRKVYLMPKKRFLKGALKGVLIRVPYCMTLAKDTTF